MASSSSSATSASASARSLRRRPLPTTLVLLLAAAALPTFAAAQCPISLTFFPDGGLGAINAPTAWSKRNQSLAGNERDDALLPIALYGNPTPKLHAYPVSPVVGAPGTLVPGSCTTGGDAAVTRRRRELLADAPGAGGELAVPAQFSFSWSLDGQAARAGQGGPAINATTGEILYPAAELGGSVWDLKDGPHTLTLSFVVAAGSGRLRDGTPVPAADLSVSRTAIFYKLTARPTAKVAFNTCTPTWGIGMTDMWPEPVPLLDADGNAVASPDGGVAAFLRPVYHVWGSLKTDINGKPYEKEDGAANPDTYQFFDRYYVREIGSPNKLEFAKPDLVPGFYAASVEGSITSDYPSLVALSGEDKYGQEGPVYHSVGVGGTFTPTDLLGKDKFSGAYVQGINQTRVGVQHAKTALLSLSGPDAPPAAGEKIDFTWQWYGLGNTTCAVDGQLRGNVQDPSLPPGACASPYTVTAADGAHTLSVTFSDVCGATRTEKLTFGAGRLWSTDAVLDGMAAVDSALPLQDPMLLQSGGSATGGDRALAGGRGRNGAEGAVASASAAMVAVAAVVAAAVL